MAEYMYLVQMDVPAELEVDFNRIYETQHVPEILKVPGVLEVKRYVVERSVPEVPRYVAAYRVASPDVPQSPAWVKASDTGDWKTLIRPYTTNRRHSLYRLLGS